MVWRKERHSLVFDNDAQQIPDWPAFLLKVISLVDLLRAKDVSALRQPCLSLSNSTPATETLICAQPNRPRVIKEVFH
jgi:hypothetical protein